MDKSSKHKTAFTTHRGTYHFNRMCFGLQGSPATFQALMTKVLRGILFSYALCYVDDLTCMSDTPERHLEHLIEIFDRFQISQPTAQPTEMSVCTYQGHLSRSRTLKKVSQLMNQKSQLSKHFQYPRVLNNFVATSV